jgi:hypothetical protein
MHPARPRRGAGAEAGVGGEGTNHATPGWHGYGELRGAPAAVHDRGERLAQSRLAGGDSREPGDVAGRARHAGGPTGCREHEGAAGHSQRPDRVRVVRSRSRGHREASHRLDGQGDCRRRLGCRGARRRPHHAGRPRGRPCPAVVIGQAKGADHNPPARLAYVGPGGCRGRRAAAWQADRLERRLLEAAGAPRRSVHHLPGPHARPRRRRDRVSVQQPGDRDAHLRARGRHAARGWTRPSNAAAGSHHDAARGPRRGMVGRIQRHLHR